jgi:hypothetical protein
MLKDEVQQRTFTEHLGDRAKQEKQQQWNRYDGSDTGHAHACAPENNPPSVLATARWNVAASR